MDHVHKHNSQATAQDILMLYANEYWVTTATFSMWVHTLWA